jgi:hypothetical protein
MGDSAANRSNDELMKLILDRINDTHREMKEDISCLRKDVSCIGEDIAAINVTIAKQQVNIEEHIRRTELAEEAIKNITGRIVPIEKYVSAWGGVGKALMVLGAISGILVALFKILGD